MNRLGFSVWRFKAMLVKEFIQLLRDRITFAMIIGMPIMQLIIFGYAINMDPKGLPTAVLDFDKSVYSRSIIQGLENTGYYKLKFMPNSLAEAESLLKRGDAQFVIHIGPDFSHKLVRQEVPSILIETDATDPVASMGALATLPVVQSNALARDLSGSKAGYVKGFNFIIHRNYNPDLITAYNIVPGLTGTILTLTMTMMTAIAMTRERERGTLENLLATPVLPLEVMLGKIMPFIIIGYLQVGVLLILAKILFQVPYYGSLILLSGCVIFFVLANLAVGFTFSTFAKSQLQAMQMNVFFFLPSLLLSGFMFPFRGMPIWAQYIGEILPLTHYLRIVRGILLKGNGVQDIAYELIAICVFISIMLVVAIKCYKETIE